MEFIISDVNKLKDIATYILSKKDVKLILFFGELGAGKTTLIKEICSILGINSNEMSSPSFSIINEYSYVEKVVYHMDLYRLKNIEQALDIGIEDYIYSNNYCFIEWPEVLAELWKSTPHLFVTISQLNDLERRIVINESNV